MRLWRSTAVCSISSCAARARQQRSSISAISSSLCRRGVSSPPTTAAISVSWSMTRRRSARSWPLPGSNHCPALFSTFGILGATASKSSATTIFNSPRRRTCCVAWDWRISPRTRRRSRSLRRRAWLRVEIYGTQERGCVARPRFGLGDLVEWIEHGHISRSKKEDRPMPIQHPNAKNAYIRHEGRFFAHPFRMVLVIETDLHTNPQHPKFDAHALADLINAGQAYVAAHHRDIDGFQIVPTSDRI